MKNIKDMSQIRKYNHALVEWYISDDKELYHKFYSNKAAIEQEMGVQLEWNELPEKKATRKKEICKISTPFPVDFVCSEILFQLILKYLMRPSVLISGFLRTNNRMESQFRIHIFMYRCGTVKITFTLQIDCHTPVSVSAIM